jgi:HNH endonuclease/Homing endonuclease associated repeat
MAKTSFALVRPAGAPVSSDDLLADLRLTAARLGTGTLTRKQYDEAGQFDSRTQMRRFSSWNSALELVGLKPSNEVHISDDRLFENLLLLWERSGRQPRRKELLREPSHFSPDPYIRRFGSWGTALAAFVEYANASGAEAPVLSGTATVLFKQTSRGPSLRTRWHVLQRDNFRCCACGASPAINPAVQLHVDHIQPWSKGGETILSNLQTLCATCNLGKSNVASQ